MGKPKKGSAAADRCTFLAQMAVQARNRGLAKLYGGSMASVARKSVVRLDKETKRRFCKKCWGPLVPGQAAFRITDKSKAQNRPILRIECTCSHVKHYPLDPKPAKTET